MKIEFYFDPSCPFCWITSRWLLLVSSDRDIDITWRPFSLALKNNEINGVSTSSYAKSHLASHRLLRVMLAAQKEHQASLIDLYTTAGIKKHVAGTEFSDDFIKTLLSDKELPAELLSVADDSTYDAELQSHIDEAMSVAGDDIGVPVIVFLNETGQKQGFFGPVLQSLPDKAESLDLWDGLSMLASSSTFYELKRGRPDGGPDVFSTAKC